jgi:Zn-dependent alcohol dehydrogenase
MKRTVVSMLIATTAGATLLAPASAVAGDLRVERSTSCSQFGRSDLKVSRQHNGLEVEYEVDTNRRGQQYRVRLFHGARRVDQQIRTTRLRSGSFTVRNVENDSRGDDRFRAVAVRLGGGNRCVVRVRF